MWSAWQCLRPRSPKKTAATDNNNKSFITLLGGTKKIKKTHPQQECSKSVCDRCGTRQHSNSRQRLALFFSAAGISRCVLEMSLRHSRIWSRSQSWSGLSGNAALGQERGWNVFWLQQVDSSGWKQTASSFSPQLTDSLPPHRLLLFGRKQSSSLFSPPDPHTKPLPGGCCSRNQVQAFDPAPDHWLKGCHFNFRPFSIPRYSSSFQSLSDTLLEIVLKLPSHIFHSISASQPTVIRDCASTKCRWTAWGVKWQRLTLPWCS